MVATPSSTGNRWGIAFAGVIVMITLGTVYAWSLFSKSLIAGLHASSTQATLPFELAIFFLGIGAWIGGRWQDRTSPRTVTIAGVLMWGVGNLLAGLFTQQLGMWWMDVTYGVLGGLGLGFGYITPVAMVTKWFPDRRGLASGMVVMGFGLGAFFYTQVINRIPSFAAAAKAATAYSGARDAAIKAGTTFDPTQYALTPEAVGAVMAAFIWSGVVFIVIGTLCAMVLRNPPEGYTVPGAVAAVAQSGYSFSPAQTFRMPQLYLLWLILFLNVTAGILVISNAVPIYSELTGATAAAAGFIYGFLSICNGLGRFFWGAVSDRLGRNMTYTVMYLIQAVIFFVMAGLHDFTLVGVAFAIVLLCYGGGFGVMPSFNADFFGTKYMGANYGFILTAWGVAGIVGPSIATFTKDRTGTFAGALLPVAIMLLIAAIIPFLARKPTPAAATAA